ncbi:dihydrofolate reductase family protein [Capilliphycus salinus ALCB114379]|uniref:dihydrofolate reductase family protein n=1 Tax=Capilliphycus salinus TaxID=2768948 RepID=UPI0039A72261
MARYVYIATSLDGFIATKDGGLDWLFDIPNPEGSDYGFTEFISGMDALVMGRNTFEKILTFEEWPYPKPVFVLSNHLKNIPSSVEGKAEIIRGNLKELVAQLQEQGYHNLYIDGGGVIQSFLEEDLIDEMIITRVPILLGEGFPLFGKLSQSLKFRHLKTQIYNNTLVQSFYRRER